METREDFEERLDMAHFYTQPIYTTGGWTTTSGTQYTYSYPSISYPSTTTWTIAPTSSTFTWQEPVNRRRGKSWAQPRDTSQ